MSRRRAMILGASSLSALELQGFGQSATIEKKGIAEIRMESSRLEELGQFYEEKIELPVSLSNNQLTVTAGNTRLIFSPSRQSGSEPFYHYAFNIPENKIELAQEWQKKRTPLLRRGNKEVLHFTQSNAHSVYYNDPAGNIVEYIARHDLQNSATGGFSKDDILYASEIGLVVDDVPQTERDVKDSLGMKYRRGYKSQSFAPVGDDHAMLILARRNRKWFPNQKQPAEIHPVHASIRGLKKGSVSNDEFQYQVEFVAESASDSDSA